MKADAADYADFFLFWLAGHRFLGQIVAIVVNIKGR
jgi:hypothetical protein